MMENSISYPQIPKKLSVENMTFRNISRRRNLIGSSFKEKRPKFKPNSYLVLMDKLSIKLKSKSYSGPKNW
jgi:hypothetical protein